MKWNAWARAHAAALNAVVSCAVAQSSVQSPATSEPATITVADPRPVWLEAVPVEPKDPTTAVVELCGDKPGELGWLSQVRADIYRTLCSSAAWFDGFFGNARFDDEYQAVHGSVAVGGSWDERDRWDQSVRFRVRTRLPQLSERFNGFVGKVDPEEYVTELRDDFDALPRQFAREQDDAVLLGLGYAHGGRGGGHFDTDVGAKLGWPLEPYAKATYRYARPFLDRNLIRLRETIFWEERERFGATTRIDLERQLSQDWLVRWTGSGSMTQNTQGVRWFSNLTLYQGLGNGRALAYQAGIAGESDREAQIVDYGLRVIFRRRIYREWLFLELRSNITWPREALVERRELNLGAGVAIEMMFGERQRN
jgi:hypothetical protein